jgi:prevent-host-death family protein
MTAAPEDLPAGEARRTFADVIGRAQHAGTVTYITHHGRRVAAVVPVEAAEALERLEDEALVRMAREANAEPGTPIPHDQVLAELDL